MPELYRIFEVSAYSLLNFLPLAILALYLFRDSLRFSVKAVSMVVVLVSILQIIIGIHVTFYPNALVSIVSLLSTAIYAISFLYVVRAPYGKSLFVLLFLSNIENYIVISSKCLEGLLFPALAHQSYRWSFSLSMLIVLSVLAGPLYLYIRNVLVPAIEIKNSGHDWEFLWLLPAVFYFIWYYTIYMINDGTSLERALLPQNTVILTVVNLGAFLVYFVAARLLKMSEQNRILEEQKSIASIQMLQYQNLQEHIQEARRARHDLRHHMTVLNGYLMRRDYEKLADYLETYSSGIGISETETLQFCSNPTVNIVLLYFSHLAHEHNIEFQVTANVSENINIPETDLSVLFSNLLENALDACIADPGEQKKIVVRINETKSTLYFTIDNTCRTKLKKSENGMFLSTKHKGTGLGIDSSRSIVAHHNGVMKIEQADEMVYISVLLNL